MLPPALSKGYNPRTTLTPSTHNSVCLFAENNDWQMIFPRMGYLKYFKSEFCSQKISSTPRIFEQLKAEQISNLFSYNIGCPPIAVLLHYFFTLQQIFVVWLVSRQSTYGNFPFPCPSIYKYTLIKRLKTLTPLNHCSDTAHGLISETHLQRKNNYDVTSDLPMNYLFATPGCHVCKIKNNPISCSQKYNFITS